MEFVYLKMILLLNGWLFANGSPVAMLHATSSQSIVFHQAQDTSARPITSPSPIDQYGGSPPKYEYKYEVSDHETGDRKSHWESRDGDNVRGAYTLYEPDGVLRTVEYTADALHGFNAVVTRNEASIHSRGSGRKKLPSNTAHSGYEQPTSNMADPVVYSGNKDQSRSGKPYKQGVTFSVVHGMRKVEDNQVKYT